MVVDETLKQLRDETGVSIMQCKKALAEAGEAVRVPGACGQVAVALRERSERIFRG